MVLWIAVLLAGGALPAGSLANDARFHRWEKAHLALTGPFLQADHWNLALPGADPAEAVELRGEPPEIGPIQARERVRDGVLRLAAGEHRAILYRETVAVDGGTVVQYRWIAPGGATLALARGGRDAGTTFDGPLLFVRADLESIQAVTKIYSDDIGGGYFPQPCDLGLCDAGEDVNFALDAVPNSDAMVTKPLSGLTAQAYATGGALTAANVWDFSPALNLSPGKVAETNVPVAADETCEAASCGYSLPTNDFMSRQDRLDLGVCVGGSTPGAACNSQVAGSCPGGGLCDTPTTNAVFDEDFLCAAGTNALQVCDPMAVDPCPGSACVAAIMLRAGSQLEGTSGQTRFCHDGQPDDDLGQNRGIVIQWMFPNLDAGGYYMQVGDSWTGSTFECTLNFFRENCGTPSVLSELKTVACNGHAGHFSTEVVGSGTVKLPSGHWIDVLVLRQLADFCLKLPSSTCGALSLTVQQIRQPVVLFMAPGTGVVAQVNGPIDAADATSWTTMNETVIRTGLLPPLDIQVGTVDDTSVALSWTPGAQLGAIERVKIYWDTDSGSFSPYAFNSDDQAGQVAFGANGPDGFPLTATVSGLNPGTTYHFTVTFLRHYIEPDTTPFTIEYESKLFPDVILGTDGGPGGTPVTYPEEVAAMTTSSSCAPTTEVSGLTLAPGSGGDVDFSWAASGDACLDHYRLLGSDDPSSAGAFTVVADTGMTPSFSGSPSATFYLVVAAGAGGEQGPLGHFGQ